MRSQCFSNAQEWKSDYLVPRSVLSPSTSLLLFMSDSLCPMGCSIPGFPVLHYLLEFAQIHIRRVDDAIQSSYPLPPCSPPALSLSQLFSNESALHIRWPKNWSLSFSFSISPSNKYSGLISFRIKRFDLLAVQWTLRSLLQHHSLKASILRCSAFFMVQLSHLYMNTGKTIALTLQTFVSKMTSLPFNMLYLVSISWYLLTKR